jgi:hypothetical protein
MRSHGSSRSRSSPWTMATAGAATGYWRRFAWTHARGVEYAARPRRWSCGTRSELALAERERDSPRLERGART